MEDRLLLCFNTKKVDFKKIAWLVSDYGLDEESTKELKEMYQELTEETPVLSGVINIIRDHIDSVFVEYLRPETPAFHEFGKCSGPRWTMVWQIIRIISFRLSRRPSLNLHLLESSNVWLSLRTLA